MINISQFVQIYQDTFLSLKKEWKPLLLWMGIWHVLMTLFVILVFSWAFYADLYAYFIEGRFGSLVWLVALLILSVLSSFIIYNFIGAVLNTENEDDNLVVIQRGIQGFIHPNNAIRSSLALFVGPAIPMMIIFVGLGNHSEIYSFARFLEPLFHQTAGYIISIIVLISFIVVYFYYISGAVFSSFIMLEDPECGCIESIQMAIKKIHGKRTQTICLMTPVVIVMFFTVWFMYGCYQTRQYPELIEQAMAVQTQHAILESNDQESLKLAEKTGLTEREKKQFKRGLAFEIFTKPIPDFNGDLPEYIHKLANYGLSREKFYAHRDQTEISELAMLYEEHPIVGRHWGILLFLAWVAFGFESLFAVLLLVRYYRSNDYQKEIEPPTKSDEDKESDKDNTKSEHLPEAVIVPTETHTPADTPSEAALQSNQDDGIAERPQTIDPGFDIPDLK